MTNRLSRDDLLQLRQQGFLVHLDTEEGPDTVGPARPVAPVTATDREKPERPLPPLRRRRRTDFWPA